MCVRGCVCLCVSVCVALFRSLVALLFSLVSLVHWLVTMERSQDDHAYVLCFDDSRLGQRSLFDDGRRLWQRSEPPVPAPDESPAETAPPAPEKPSPMPKPKKRLTLEGGSDKALALAMQQPPAEPPAAAEPPVLAPAEPPAEAEPPAPVPAAQLHPPPLPLAWLVRRVEARRGDFEIAKVYRAGVFIGWSAVCHMHVADGQKCNKTKMNVNGMSADECKHRIMQWCVAGGEIDSGPGGRQNHMAIRPCQFKTLMPVDGLQRAADVHLLRSTIVPNPQCGDA